MISLALKKFKFTGESHGRYDHATGSARHWHGAVYILITMYCSELEVVV
jgi:hypothetical protein